MNMTKEISREEKTSLAKRSTGCQDRQTHAVYFMILTIVQSQDLTSMCRCSTIDPYLTRVYFILLSFLSSDIFFFFQAEDGIRDLIVTGVQTCALPIFFQAEDGIRDLIVT